MYLSGVERHGILREEMQDLFAQAGFESIKTEVAFEQEKDIEAGGMQTFPFLIAYGRKPM